MPGPSKRWSLSCMGNIMDTVIKFCGTFSKRKNIGNTLFLGVIHVFPAPPPVPSKCKLKKIFKKKMHGLPQMQVPLAK
jgi:hypothetical protein